MEKKNNSLVIILMGVIIVILAVLCVLFATDTISFNSKNIDNNEVEQDNTTIVKSYNFGDDINLSNLSNINYSSIGFPEENGDFSKWKVLNDEGEYITLFYVGEELLSGKADKDDTISAYKERQILFSSNGIDFGSNGEIRLLNESDLLLLGCNFDTLTCSNSPDWIKGWTSFTNNNFKYTINNGKLNAIGLNEPVLAHAKPVIRILKSNIK